MAQWQAEAVFLFEKGLVDEFVFRCERGGHLFSKMQLHGGTVECISNRQPLAQERDPANAMAQQVAAGQAAIPGVTLLHQVVATELLPNLREILV